MLPIHRRTFLATVTAATAGFAFPAINVRAATPTFPDLVAMPATVPLIGDKGPATDVWGYNGQVPGPELRLKQGEQLRIKVRNDLKEPTTIHWHGIRADSTMDGVPFLSQRPIEPGETFTYDFPVKDAGTFWYHPHVNNSEQVGRGLAGALIVEEPDPITVDHDLVWVIDDWRLAQDASIVPFGNMMNASHGGRLGNVPTLNGLLTDDFKVRAGERIRLRLINVANARNFALSFTGHNPWQIAIDGHPVVPRQINQEPVIVTPGGRVDLVLDMTGKPGESHAITDGYYQRSTYTFTTLKYSDEPPLRAAVQAPPKRLADNPVALPDIKNAILHEMDFQGGAMGGLAAARFKGETVGLRELAGMGMVWAVNGEVIPHMTAEDIGKPMLTLKRGQTYRLRWRNSTAFAHPIHLHGHSFHVIAQNGKLIGQPVIQDTVLIQPDDWVDVAFVADNPGDWALHCHVLEHADSGMMGFVRVA